MASVKGPLPQDLYDILACPVCKRDIKYNAQRTALLCLHCKAVYPIRNGIPILLPPATR